MGVFEFSREAEIYLEKGAYSNILTPLLPLWVGSLIGINALHLGSGEALPDFVCERQLSNLFKQASGGTTRQPSFHHF